MLARTTSRPIREIPPRERDREDRPRARLDVARAGARRADADGDRLEVAREARVAEEERVPAEVRPEDRPEDEVDVLREDEDAERARVARPVVAVAFFCVLAAAMSAQSVV